MTSTLSKQTTIDFNQARQNMVDGQVRTNKVTDHALIRQMRRIPRELFVPPELRSTCYVDADLRLPNGRFLLEPMVLARLIQSADIKPNDRVLDVGCATGYSTALIAGLGALVLGIEEDRKLIADAVPIHEELEVGNTVFAVAPLLDGYPTNAPYDVIIVNGAVAELPTKLFDQLADNGRLLCIWRDPSDGAIPLTVGKAMIYQKSNNVVSGRALFDAASPYIVPLSRKQKFVF